MNKQSATSGLKQVTMTGIDDKTDLSAVQRISYHFPFVEWGLLLSQSKTGLEPRFPSLKTMQRFQDLGVRHSVHLCGDLALAAAMRGLYAIPTALQLGGNPKRVQINLGSAIARRDDPKWIHLSRMAVQYKIQIIVQCSNFHVPSVRDAVLSPVNDYSEPGVAFLHDASGGRGIAGPFELPTTRSFVGYAGGIGPNNVIEKIAEVDTMSFPNPYWIDMESGIRTDDRLDLAKVERILELCAPHVTGRH